MNELVRLLVELSEDPLRREELLNDPEAVLGAAGLSQEERAVLLTRDPQKIMAFLGQTVPTLCVFMILPAPEPPETPEPPPEKPPEEPAEEVPAVAAMSFAL